MIFEEIDDLDGLPEKHPDKVFHGEPPDYDPELIEAEKDDMDFLGLHENDNDQYDGPN